MNTLGALLLAIGALGTEEFFAKLDRSEAPHHSRIAQIGFRAIVNRIGLYVLVSIVGFVVLLPFAGLILSLLLAPLVYFAWRLAALLTTQLHRATEHLLDYGVRTFGSSCIGFAVASLPLLLLHSLATILVSIVKFGVSVPLYLVTEKFVEPRVLKLLRGVEQRNSREKMWALRREAFMGVILVLFGFLYQLAGSVMLMMKP